MVRDDRETIRVEIMVDFVCKCRSNSLCQGANEGVDGIVAMIKERKAMESPRIRPTRPKK